MEEKGRKEEEGATAKEVEEEKSVFPLSCRIAVLFSPLHLPRIVPRIPSTYFLYAIVSTVRTYRHSIFKEKT